MSGKLDFGCDFLHLARTLMWQSEPENGPTAVSDAAARFFLLQWGFSVEEVDEANRLFFERFAAGTLGEFYAAYKRIVEHVTKERAAQERLVIQLAALGSLDFDVKDVEANFLRWFQDEFDLRPSEFAQLCDRGWDLAIGLDYLGKQYMQEKSAG